MRILKFALEMKTSFNLDLPKGSAFLDIQKQRNVFCMWFLVPEILEPLENELRSFKLYATGEYIKAPPGKYLKTVQDNSEYLVFHLFETAEGL